MDGRIDITPAAPSSQRVQQAPRSSGSFVLNHQASPFALEVEPDGKHRRRESRKSAPSMRIVRIDKLVSLVIFDPLSGEVYKEIALPGVAEILGGLNVPRECCIDLRS